MIFFNHGLLSLLVCFFRIILLCLSKKTLHVVGATVAYMYGMSLENIVKFVSRRKMFVKEL